jgi:hypothetical protein
VKKLVTQEFRQIIKNEFPGLSNNQSYWKLLRRLMFGRTDEGMPIIDAVNLAITEHGCDYGTDIINLRNYTALDFLKAFQQDVMSKHTFKWSGWSFTEHKARTAYVVFSTTFQAALDKEKAIQHLTLKDLVYMDTGRKFSLALMKIERDLERETAIRNSFGSTPEQQVLTNYLHKLSNNHFSKILSDNLLDTYKEATNIHVKTKRDYQLSLLSSIQENLIPLYQHSKKGNTARVFAFNESILLLSKPLRHALCKGWCEFDLASAQLAIISQCWDIPFIRNYLNSGNKVWKDLAIHMGLDPLDVDIKGTLKDLLYSLVFGKTQKNLEKVVAALIGPEYVQLWLSHPVISTLLCAREVRMKQIKMVKSITTVYGKEVFITETTKAKINAQVRSALAQEAQALEFWLMQPVIDLALTTDDFVITLWQHDGCSIKFTDQSKQQRWINRILKVVEDRAKSINIPTHLEFQFL